MSAETYIMTKEQCEAGINIRPVVCRRCGGHLSAIETVDNSGRPTYWPGCEACDHFDYGVERRVFLAALWLVRERRHIKYAWMDKPSDPIGSEWERAQVSGAIYDIQDVEAAFLATKDAPQ